MKHISKEKRIVKARKHLEREREHLEYLRECYVENERERTGGLLDIRFKCYNGTIRESRRKDYLKDIKETKERIAKFERIVL